MADNKKAKKADARRVALKQDYERGYLQSELEEAMDHMVEAYRAVVRASDRLRAGFPRKADLRLKRGRR
jgi:hypothetical protein